MHDLRIPRCKGALWASLLILASVAGASSGTAGTLQKIQTVFLIIFENKDWSNIRGNTNAPFLNNVLLPMGAHCENYSGPHALHPSLPNYIWLEAGDNLGIRDDANPYAADCLTPANIRNCTNHLVTLLNNAGISWKAYFEDSPTNAVALTGYLNYAVRHNPFAYFYDVVGTNTGCFSTFPYALQHIRPFSDLAADLASNHVARFNVITPNACNDMHDACPPLYNGIQQGDDWLAAQLPAILNSPAYQNNGLVLITFDEAAPLETPIGMLALSPLVKTPGYSNTIPYSHSSTLRTLQEIFGVGPFLGEAAIANDLSDLFQGLALSRLSRRPDGALELTVTGAQPGCTYILQASQDFSHWTPITTNTASSTTFLALDPAPATLASRFYRVQSNCP